MVDESRFIIAMQQESKLKALTEAFRVRNDEDRWNSKHMKTCKICFINNDIT